MAQLTIYIDDDTARAIDEAARVAGLSRSAWAGAALRQKAAVPKRRVRSLAELAGTWEDDRTIEEIMADIDNYPPDREVPSFD